LHIAEISVVAILVARTLPDNLPHFAGFFQPPSMERKLLIINRRNALAIGLGGAMSAFGLSPARAGGPLFGAIEGGEEFLLATDAYIYGYPLVTMELTRRVVTNVPAVEGTRGPWASSSS
jgi:hypothetical protein